ncbi:MAG TPA: NAD(P)/FAD-dependent oxidoreductase [Micromonosporaceae bacterium]|nr:NAD(P)/FAD-dependent oxidoreductase [Micromonosporaceae bacterium]
MEYDVVVVGARPAGAATAMLLARAGLKVLAVDRARFPSDTLSTHQIQVPGSACLARWGVLDKVVASNCPPAMGARFDSGKAVLTGDYPASDGVRGIYSPRRTVLDTILVDAARDAGADVLEGFDVDDVVASDGRVTGIRGTEKGASGQNRTFTAHLVIGADGKHSRIARAVGAETYRERPTQSANSYAYWSGLPITGGEIYLRDRRLIGAWPTNDGLTLTFIEMPIADFKAFHADSVASTHAALDMAANLGERAHAATLVEHIRATPDLPNVFRKPYGPGWALVGDAGLVMDPITGQGIGHALRDAQWLTDAVIAGLRGDRPLDEGLAEFQRRRDDASGPMFDFTTDLASFRPDPTADILFGALERKPEHVSDFLGMLTGTYPVKDYFAGRHMGRVVGIRGTIRVMASQLRGRRMAASEAVGATSS